MGNDEFGIEAMPEVIPIDLLECELRQALDLRVLERRNPTVLGRLIFIAGCDGAGKTVVVGASGKKR
jgi:hypothetical protein